MNDVERTSFTSRFELNGGRVNSVRDLRSMRDYVLGLARTRSKRPKIAIERALYHEADWSEASDCTLSIVDAMAESGPLRQALIDTDVGVGRVDHGVAQTGQAVIYSGGEWGRMMAFISPVYVGVLPVDRMLPDLAALFSHLSTQGLRKVAPTMTLLCGSSASGDIEHVLVSGVHGPLECHLLLLDEVR